MRRLFTSVMVLLIFLPSIAFSEVVNLDVPTYDQDNFYPNQCTNDCTPTAAAMILGYWDSHGWPRMVHQGAADYDRNPSGVSALVEDLATTMGYTCNSGTDKTNVAPGIVQTASNMDPGADFVSNDINYIIDETKEMVFQSLKNWIDNGWPILFTSAPGLKYYCPHDGSEGQIQGPNPHSMVMTGYIDSPLRKIYLNSGWSYPHDVFLVDWDDLGLDLSTEPEKIWVQYVIPGGIPSFDAWGLFYFRSNVGPNSIAWGWDGCDPQVEPVCDTMGLGLDLDPVSSTTVVAENIDTGFSMNLWNFGHPANPYEFGRRIAYDPAKTGPWVITATNGPYSGEGTTYSIEDAGQMPFLRNVQVTGSGLTPTIFWTVPSGTGADRIKINVIDRHTWFKLWWSPNIELETTSYRLPDGLLQEDHPYIIRAIIQDTVSGTIYGPDKSRAESFFEFTPLEEGEPQTVFLPTVGQDLNTTDEFGASYTFDIDVEQDVPCFIDPFVAIGYDYTVGAEDTVKFASVTLPEVGNNLFDLYLFNGTGFYLAMENLESGITYNFGPGGVDKFRVLGIEVDAELDPLDVTAFITELTFTETGRFTGSMVPIINIDNDNDGILDLQDNCDNSYLSGTVVIDGCDSGVENVLLEDGCTILDRILQCADGAKNHGNFVSSVSHTTNSLKKIGKISGMEKGKIQRCASKADIP